MRGEGGGLAACSGGSMGRGVGGLGRGREGKECCSGAAGEGVGGGAGTRGVVVQGGRRACAVCCTALLLPKPRPRGSLPWPSRPCTNNATLCVEAIIPAYILLCLPTTHAVQDRYHVLHPVPHVVLQVPEAWARYAYPSLKPLASWVADYHTRIAFMRSWLMDGEPACFWLPGFFFPQVRARVRVCAHGWVRRWRDEILPCCMPPHAPAPLLRACATCPSPPPPPPPGARSLPVRGTKHCSPS